MVAPGATQLTLLVEFTSAPSEAALPDAEAARAAVAQGWQNFWKQGGAVDFTGSTDPRRERARTARGAVAVPHGREQRRRCAAAGRGALLQQLERQVPSRDARLARGALRRVGPARAARAQHALVPAARSPARRRARSRTAHAAPGGRRWSGRKGARARAPSIPSSCGSSRILSTWPRRSTARSRSRRRWRSTGRSCSRPRDLLASWPTYDAKAEALRARAAHDPGAGEFRAARPRSTRHSSSSTGVSGLPPPRTWRERLGLKRDPKWDDVLKKLSPLPQKGGLYLAAESQPDLWERTRSAECSKRAKPECPNRDHPSFVAALGYLPGAGADRETMRRTLDAVVSDWDLRQTWGWDWPMLAMTACAAGRTRPSHGFPADRCEELPVWCCRHDAAAARGGRCRAAYGGGGRCAGLSPRWRKPTSRRMAPFCWPSRPWLTTRSMLPIGDG